MNLLKTLSKEIETIYPLTPVQQGMLFHTLMQPNSGIYLQQYRYIMTMNNLDVSAFKQAWQAVVERHQVLRTAFVHESQEQALQVVFKNVELPFTFLDYRQFEKEQQKEKVEHLLAQEREQGLIFNQAPLMRVTLIQLDNNRYQFIRSYHHILMDAWCFSLIMAEFLQLYRHFSQGTPLQLKPAVHYQAYIAWLSENQNQQAEQNFWQEKLAGFNEPTSLGIEQPNHVVNTSAQTNQQILSKDVITSLNSKQTAKLKTVANQCQVTLNTLLQGAWGLTLAKYSEQTDIVFGVTVAGRSIDLPGIENIVGLFINTLPLRCKINENTQLTLWLQTLQQENLAIRDYEQTSLAAIQQWSDVNEQPLFNSIFVFENTPMDKALNLDTLDFSVDEAENRSNLNYPLTVTVLPAEDLHLELTYRCSDFEHKSVEAMLFYFKQLLINLCELASTLQAKLTDIEPNLNHQLALNSPLSNGNSTKATVLVQQLFSQLAQQQPGAKAITFAQSTLSYLELEQRSNRLAHYLLSQYQLKPDSLVGLCLAPSIDMAIAIMAILKAGAAYVPLDPNYPINRLHHMIEDAGLEVILSQQTLASHDVFLQAPEKRVVIDSVEFNHELASYPGDHVPDITIVGNQLAYVIYTSGTTGKPKGVMVEHQQLSNFLLNIEQRYQIKPDDKVLQFSTINFDISVEEFFGALCFGAELVIRDQDCVSDPIKFYEFCQHHHISVISLPTAFWHQLVAYHQNVFASSLRLVIIGGEALQTEMLNQWFTLHELSSEKPVLINTYGPTETTVTATSYVMAQAPSKTVIPIGNVNPNTQLLILNKHQKQVPIGGIGELYIGGNSVARGYLNQPVLTEKSFPFITLFTQAENIPLSNVHEKSHLNKPQSRYYRTGDLVRNCADGELEFIGRIDDQVKIRGYRIEPNEIEHVIQQYSAIKQSIVISQQKSSSEKVLVAYVVPNNDINEGTVASNTKTQVLIQKLQQYLKANLADYMVPSAIICLPSLPLTTNGKINKQALPAITDNQLKSIVADTTTFIAPNSTTETMLSDIWKKVLKLEKISQNDNFFHLGGHSLLVIQVLSGLRKQGVIIEAAQLFKTPTLSSLAQAIEQANTAMSLTTSDKKTELFNVPENLIPLNCQKLTPEMLAMVSLTNEELEQITARTLGGAENIQDVYPLAPLQEGILFHHMVDPSNDPYVVSALISVNNTLSFNKFIAGLEFIIARHDVLRTAILWRELRTPLQVVNRYCKLSISWLEFNEQHDNRNIIDKMSQYQKEKKHHIDLEQAPLLQLIVAKDKMTDQHAVLFLEHHIIADHVGVELLVKELARYLNNKDEQFAPSVPYRNFVSHSLQQEAANQVTAKAFFTEMLSDIEQATTPFNLTNIQGNGDQVKELKTRLSAALSEQIRLQATQLSIAPAVIFHAAWAIVVDQCSGNTHGKDNNHKDVVFGTVMSGRLQNIENIDAMLGMFINTLPLRVNLANCSALQLVQQINQSLQSLMPYEQTSLALAQQCSGLSAEQPLFSALLNYRHSKESNRIEQDEVFKGFTIEQVAERSNYPFGLSVDDFGDNFDLTVEIDQRISSQKITQYVINALTYLSENILAESSADNKGVLLKNFTILSDDERQQQLNDWAVSPPHPVLENTLATTLDQLVTLQSQQTTDKCALIYNDQKISYQQLEQRANQLAHFLYSQNNSQQVFTQTATNTNEIIGLCLDKSINMVISILAIHKIGAAYLPIDPNAPTQRKIFQLTDAKVTRLITDSKNTNLANFAEHSAIVIDQAKWQEQISSFPTTPLPKQQMATINEQSSQHLAYVLYTSGTTGQPKGVKIEHSGVINLINHQTHAFKLSSQDTFIWLANYIFDASIEQLFSALANGACLVIPNDTDIQQPDTIAQLINRYQVTHLDGTPSYLSAISNNQSLPSIKRVIAGGESLTPKLRQRWHDKIINVYGPTEASITAIQHLDFTSSHSVNTIGRPISNNFALVLDQDLNLIPQGLPGELHLGGVGLAKGYLNQPELSDEKFIKNPYQLAGTKVEQDKLYKTGDLVRWQADGCLEFLGRIDHQINIRGVRIELAEIEQKLLTYPLINEILVTVLNSNTADFDNLGTDEDLDTTSNLANQLVAYMVGDPNQKTDLIEKVTDFAKQNLPSYMVPQHWLVIEKMPLSATGKIDQKSLPKINQRSLITYIAPKTKTEKMLAGLWQEILGFNAQEDAKANKQVSREDNFFELGGHSLLIMQMITALQQRDIQITAKQLFSHPTLHILAGVIDDNKNQANIESAKFKAPEQKIPTDTDKITPQMLSMVKLDETELAIITDSVVGGARNIQDIYPLAPLQQGILFHHRMDESNDPYVMPAYLKIKGKRQFEQFIDGLNYIIKRHDTLRTAILWRHLPEPVQVVSRQAQLPLEWLTLVPEEDYLEQMQVLDAKQALSINIEQAPLLKVTVAHDLANDLYVIRMLDHHIISDHVSMDIVQQELALIFAGQKEQLPAPVQYRGFIAQLLAQQEQQLHQAKQFFTKQLNAFTEPSSPFSLAYQEGNLDDIDEQDTWLSTELSHDIRQQAKKLQLNPAILFHSAFAMVLAACSNKADIVFGTVMSGRLQGVKGTESMMGMFINTLPIRLNLSELSAQKLVQQTQQALLALIPYEQTPLAEIQQYSELTSETPLFNTLLNYRHTKKKQKGQMGDLSQLTFIDPKERTNYPFAISIDDYGEDFLINCQVPEVLDVSRISEYFTTALHQLMSALKAEQTTDILNYSVLPITEQKRLVTLNYKPVDYPQGTCIYQLFEQQAQLSPEQTALIFNDQSLSYQIFDEKTNQLANYLIKSGVKTNDYVALYIDRSLDMVIAIWAILKSGAAYVPIDITLPEARINIILNDSGCKVLLTQQHLLNNVETYSGTATCKLVAIDGGEHQGIISHLSTKTIIRENKQSDLSSAYLIYTSGSTGEPKGVICHHQGLINRVDWMQKQYQLTPEDKVLQKTPYSFDVSVWEFIWPLITGATLVIAEPEGHKNPRYLADIMQQQQITHLHFVPSMLDIMISDGHWQNFRFVKKVFCSGETLSYELQQRFFALQTINKDKNTEQSVELHNLYGPTEASIDVSYWHCQENSLLPIVPIGKPIQNTQLLIIDNHGKLAPYGVEGELYIGGIGLAKGYLNKPKLTAKSFINYPFNTLEDEANLDLFPSEKLYRTGDLVRFLPDGNIDYIARLDHQVKIRGLRVELGEIEFILNKNEYINSTQIAVKLDQRSEQHLVAYCRLNKHSSALSSNEKTDLIENLKQDLKNQLPSYMVPEHYQFIEQWPLTSNGKINKKQLPEPNFFVSSHHIIAPSNTEQSKLLAIWAELLMIPTNQISVDSNFFELGGHSILAMKLISAIESEFDTTLSLQNLFKSPTVATIAEQIIANQSKQGNELDLMEQLLNEFEENV